jgi:DNA-directed RNA polymerase subunit RPC12/RpoP
MAIQVREPGTGSVTCPDCGHQLRRTDMILERDQLVLQLECPSCGYKRKCALP